MKIPLLFLSVVHVCLCGAIAQITPSQSPRDPAEQTAQIERALEQAMETVRTAKRPEDLDQIITQLDQLQEKRVAYSPSIPNLLPAKLASAKNFARSWQEYLAAAQTGDMKHAREVLEQLDRTENISWIPRSEILRRMRNPMDFEEVEIVNSAKEILGKIKGLDDLSGAMAELEKLKPNRGGQLARCQPSIYAIIEAFAPINNAYNDFKAGLPVPLNVPERKQSGFEEVLTRLRSALFVLILPRVLELPPEIHANPGEGPLPLLRRIATQAAAKGDYLLTARARVAEETIQGPAGAYQISGEREQAAFFLRASRQEQGGEFAQAVMSYQAALATGAEVIPSKVIGERLVAIKAKHPAEYATGSDPAFVASQNPARLFNYAVQAPSMMEVFPKMKAPTPFSPPPNRMVVPIPRSTLFRPATPSPSPK